MIYVIIAILIFVSELLYMRLANRYNIIDCPNERSSHTDVTLRGGGIIFPIAMWFHALFFQPIYGWFLLGLTLLAAVSFFDDLRSASRKLRFFVQFLVMVFLLLQWNAIGMVSWWYILIMIIGGVAVINAYNFMDGFNGITGGYNMVVLISLLIINARLPEPFIESSYLFVALIASVIFCFYNFREKARCFAGDVGATAVGFIVIFAIDRKSVG